MPTLTLTLTLTLTPTLTLTLTCGVGQCDEQRLRAFALKALAHVRGDVAAIY